MRRDNPGGAVPARVAEPPAAPALGDVVNLDGVGLISWNGTRWSFADGVGYGFPPGVGAVAGVPVKLVAGTAEPASSADSAFQGLVRAVVAGVAYVQSEGLVDIGAHGHANGAQLRVGEAAGTLAVGGLPPGANLLPVGLVVSATEVLVRRGEEAAT